MVGRAESGIRHLALGNLHCKRRHVHLVDEALGDVVEVHHALRQRGNHGEETRSEPREKEEI
jgi:hypothetical protein